MTDIFYADDHLLLVVDYNNPFQHKHWAKHLLICLNGTINCIIGSRRFGCEGIMINSNVPHTIERGKNDVLAYMFAQTSDIAQEMEKRYLKGVDFHVVEPETIQAIRDIWNTYIDRNDVIRMQATYSMVYNKILSICSLIPTKPNIQETGLERLYSCSKTKKKLRTELSAIFQKHYFFLQAGFPIYLKSRPECL